MPIKIFKKNWKKIALSAVAMLFVVIILIGVFINIYGSRIMARRIKSTILASTDSLYSVDFARLGLRIFEKEIVIDQIDLKPNLEVYNRRKKLKLAPNTLYNLQVKRLIIDNIHPIALFFNKKLDIAQIVINAPNLNINYEQNRDEDTVLVEKKTPYQLISKVLRSAHVQNIVLSDIKVKYTNGTGSNTDFTEFKELNIKATDFLLDSASQTDQSRFLFCRDVSAELNNFSGTSFDKRYHYQVNSLTFSTQNSQLNITGMSFLPVKIPTEFFKTTDDDCYALKLDSLRLNHFDFKTYSKYHKIYGSNLILTNANVEIFSNPSPNDTTIDQSKNFPQAELHRLKANITIDTVSIVKGNIFYTEYGKKTGQPGKVGFNNINGKIFNVTNNKKALSKNNIATAQLQASLMNAGKLDAQFSFNLTDPLEPFTYKGHMGTMALKIINPVAKPLGMVEISSGNLKQLDFNMAANKIAATGSLTVLYNDLKVAILTKGDDSSKLKKMTIASLLANTLVIKRNNPTRNEAARAFKINQKRVKSNSMFSFMWKSLYVGLKSSAGYDAKTEKTVKQKVVEFKQNKLNRKAKKAARQKRRAERKQRKALKEQEQEAKKAQQAQPPQ